ncbi:MAG: alpha/beta hydrolase [Gammaproteobacteria bacterium]|nr:alpha/beta hydrolase [Gammaproteobacteria bacterium]MDH5239268.1 alpha/beta hydrolase [Gammaproteobacteria bacterium]MDH5260004.1 alpha/beta hydrolase [Gammaproteobacteria bacterium]MDH5620493.1 alpha/beta hydrolase [Gammaproteobacteria bacterium]
MKIQRREVLLGALAAGISAASNAQTGASPKERPLPTAFADPVELIDLWPQGVPGMPENPPEERVVERSKDPKVIDRHIQGITRPHMVVFRPQLSNGAAVMIMPGGGYKWVVVDKEGYEVGRWLAERGYTVFALFYRLPGDGWAAGPNVALSDAQRAMRIIRHRAGDYGIDPQRVAAMGFSAGGHVCADLATRFATPTYDAGDEADALSARPLLAAPIYPVMSMTLPIAHEVSREMLIGKDASAELERAHSPQYNVSADTPPCFLVHAEDDMSVVVENTLVFRAALREQGIPVETHLFTHGGHGFSLRFTIGKPVSIWPELFVRWSQSMGLIQE